MVHSGGHAVRAVLLVELRNADDPLSGLGGERTGRILLDERLPTVKDRLKRFAQFEPRFGMVFGLSASQFPPRLALFQQRTLVRGIFVGRRDCLLGLDLNRRFGDVVIFETLVVPDDAIPDGANLSQGRRVVVETGLEFVTPHQGLGQRGIKLSGDRYPGRKETLVSLLHWPNPQLDDRQFGLASLIFGHCGSHRTIRLCGDGPVPVRDPRLEVLGKLRQGLWCVFGVAGDVLLECIQKRLLQLGRFRVLFRASGLDVLLKNIGHVLDRQHMMRGHQCRPVGI